MSCILPPSPDSNKDYFDVFQNYEIEVERRDELKKYLSIMVLEPLFNGTDNQYIQLKS